MIVIIKSSWILALIDCLYIIQTHVPLSEVLSVLTDDLLIQISKKDRQVILILNILNSNI